MMQKLRLLAAFAVLTFAALVFVIRQGVQFTFQVAKNIQSRNKSCFRLNAELINGLQAPKKQLYSKFQVRKHKWIF